MLRMYMRDFPNRIYAETASICVTIYYSYGFKFSENEGQEDGPGRNLPKTIYEIVNRLSTGDNGRRETLEKRADAVLQMQNCLLAAVTTHLMPLFGEPFE